MRVEIDEEKKGKEMAFALSISIEMIDSPPPRPLINHLKESEQAHPYLSCLSKSRTF